MFFSNYRLSEIADLCLGKMLDQKKNKGDFQPYLGNSNVRWGDFDLSDLQEMRFEESEEERYGIVDGDIVMCEGGEPGRCAIWREQIPNMKIQKALHRIRAKNVDHIFLYYKLLDLGKKKFWDNFVTGTTIKHLSGKVLAQIEIAIPSMDIQRKIGRVLAIIDEKIALNQKINRNLEEQLDSIFANRYSESVIGASTNSCPQLGDLVSIIDNRGKTPPLTTETIDYPIIDVGALKGTGRIVDFGNCTKYVDQITYETWFRSGHPKPWDILISTVGSLAEMKVYLGDKGCMAQNVVALRPTEITPLYLYQYLKFIRSDLVAYNIGSVQPSIKVTHIIKHPIYVPESKSMDDFERIAQSFTERIYANCRENETLKLVRDALLPKLMSGELDVSELDV